MRRTLPALFGVLLGACATPVVVPTPPGAPGFAIADIDCDDAFQPLPDSMPVVVEGFFKSVRDEGQFGLAADGSGQLYIRCLTTDRRPMPWAIVKPYLASSGDALKWDRYRYNIVRKAQKDGCAGVAVRKFAPNLVERYTYGAFCIDPRRGPAVGAQP